MEKKQRFPALTGLKGIFVFFIVWFHTLPMTPFVERIPLSSFVKNYGGTIGNCMFFLLSGFLLAHGYRDRIGRKEIAFKDYLLRRLQKLYPLHVITNLAMLVVMLFEFGVSSINLKRLSLTMLLLQGGGLDGGYPYNDPTWFLSALFVCYIVFFAIAFYAKTPMQYYCAIAFGIAWGYNLLHNGGQIPFCFKQNGTAFLNFFAGCGLYEIYPRIDKKVHKWLQPVCFVILVVSFYLMMRHGVEIIAGDTSVAFPFFICPLILYVALENPLAAWVLGSKPMAYLGKVSVSLYFWHFVLFVGYRYVYSLLWPGVEIGNGAYGFYLVLLMVLSDLSYRFLENRPKKKQPVKQNA